MRALRIVGLTDGGATVVCEDTADGERFTLPCNDRLRAAARGDAGRFGQQESDGEPQLRPREVQARIRAGATLEEVAALAKTSVRRIESFAHPVLLERATMADRGRGAHPSTDGVTAKQTVEQLVGATLAARGQDEGVEWDAYRDGDSWVLVLTWHAGRSQNRARWTFHPGPAGGTLTARDETAAEIVDPSVRAPRPVREPTRPAAPAPGAAVAGSLLDPTEPTVSAPPAAPAGAATGSAAGPAAREAERLVEDTVTDERAGVLPARAEQVVRTGTDSARGVGRRATRPPMPSWEDVLLGTRQGR
ncbi:septation protein SepH [Nakamurella endophytica]|uniref:septation protein SepH n=1 Tax=Nakamurella endophytica TaxID=1748367 RepID=UPI001667EDB3|nr:septation protein SepH [Nakamurella endophytica]